MDGLLRKRILAYLQASVTTLHSLLLVLRHFSNIQISSDVKNAAEMAVTAVVTTIQNVNSSDYDSAIQHARIALDESSLSYYSENVISQLYFPTEHLLAIYLPLLAPFIMPVVLKFFGELKRWRRKSQEEKKKKQEKKKKE